MDGHSSSAAHTMGPRVHFSSVCEQSHWWPTSAYSYQWFKQRLILSVSELSISQQSQIKENIEPSLCLPENLISKHVPLYHDTMIWPARASNPDSLITVARQHVSWRYQQRHRGRPISLAILSEIFILIGYFLSASLYVSKRGAYWDRLCRDVVGCHARALWPNGAS